MYRLLSIPKMSYLNVSQSDITFIVSAQSRYTHSVYQLRQTVTCIILSYLKGVLGKRLYYWIRYQGIVQRDGLQSQWPIFKHLFVKWGLSAIHQQWWIVTIKLFVCIANNPTFHERRQHIEAYCHFIKDMDMQHGKVTFLFVMSGSQLGDLFTKTLSTKNFFSLLCSELDMIDIYALAWEGVSSTEVIL